MYVNLILEQLSLCHGRVRAQMRGHVAHDAWMLCGHGMAHAPALDIRTWPGKSIVNMCLVWIRWCSTRTSSPQGWECCEAHGPNMATG
jgi:hypothetical protein